MTYIKNSHCSYCGQPFEAEQAWPRRCARCGSLSYLNPTPVAVVLIPVSGLPGEPERVLTVRRNIEPRRGELALPGGYINYGEAWQAAGAREVWEETGLRLAAESIQEFRVLSAPDSTLLIFGVAAPVAATSLPPFAPNEEVSEVALLAAPQRLAFPLHTQVLAEYFRRRGS